MLVQIIAALAGLYLIGVVVAALKSGTIRYRQARHTRASEPKTYWLTAGWYGVLGLLSLLFALTLFREARRDACLDRGGSWNAEDGTCGGPALVPPPD